MTNKWTYHVAYAHPMGFGDIEIFFDQKITSRAHINTARDSIAASIGMQPKQLAIISYQLLSAPDLKEAHDG